MFGVFVVTGLTADFVLLDRTAVELQIIMVVRVDCCYDSAQFATVEVFFIAFVLPSFELKLLDDLLLSIQCFSQIIDRHFERKNYAVRCFQTWCCYRMVQYYIKWRYIIILCIV